MDMTQREKELFDSLDEAAKSHPLVRDDKGMLRFKVNKCVKWLADKKHGDLLSGPEAGWFSREELREVYRMMGYSLGGYCELIDQGAL